MLGLNSVSVVYLSSPRESLFIFMLAIRNLGLRRARQLIDWVRHAQGRATKAVGRSKTGRLVSTLVFPQAAKENRF